MLKTTPSLPPYENYEKHKDKDQKLKHEVVRKALDLAPEDDVNINQTKTYNGIGWKELLVLLGVTGIGAGGYAAYQQIQETQQTNTITEKLTFEVVDENGNIVPVEHVSKMPK